MSGLFTSSHIGGARARGPAFRARRDRPEHRERQHAGLLAARDRLRRRSARSNAHGAGRGVDVVGVRAVRDLLLERRLQQELPAERREARARRRARRSSKSRSASRGRRLMARSIASSTRSRRSRRARRRPSRDRKSLLQAESLADPLPRHGRAPRPVAARHRRAGARRRSTGYQRSRAQIADVQRDASGGRRIGTAAACTCRTSSPALVRQLSELIDIDVLERDDGGVDITIGNGRALVIGDERLSAIDRRCVAAAGFAALISGGVDITGGSRPAASSAASCTRATCCCRPTRTDLDTLAYEVANR